MTSPATLFQCTAPCCLEQVNDAAWSGLSADPEPSKYDSMAMILDSTCMLPSIKDLLAAIESPRRLTGRRGYSVVSMFRSLVAKFLLGSESTQAFIRELKRSAGLRSVCGLVNGIPHKSTFSRFYAKLAENAAALEQAQVEVVTVIRKYLPNLGLTLAIDGTDVQAYTKQYKKKETYSDPDAKKGPRTPKSKHGIVVTKRTKKNDGDGSGDGHKEFFIGYKVHMICDTETGLPLGYTFHPANVSEKRELPKVLDKVLGQYDGLAPHYLTRDKGYDGEPIADAIMKRRIVPIIDIASPASKGPTKHPNRHKGGLYDPIGNPTCPDSQHTPMSYLGSERADDGHIYHLYQCNPDGCELKKRSSGAMVYCSTREIHREEVEEGNYRIQGPVARANSLWQELYDKRSEIERLFSRLKGSRSLDKLTYRTMPKVRAHVGLSILGYLGTALGRVRAGDMDGIRTMTLEDEL